MNQESIQKLRELANELRDHTGAHKWLELCNLALSLADDSADHPREIGALRYQLAWEEARALHFRAALEQVLKRSAKVTHEEWTREQINAFVSEMLATNVPSPDKRLLVPT